MRNARRNLERRRRDDRKLKGEDRRQTPPSSLSPGHPALPLQAGLIWSCYCDYSRRKEGVQRVEEGWTDCSFLAVSGLVRSECKAFFWNEDFFFFFQIKKKKKKKEEERQHSEGRSCGGTKVAIHVLTKTVKTGRCVKAPCGLPLLQLLLLRSRSVRMQMHKLFAVRL